MCFSITKDRNLKKKALESANAMEFVFLIKHLLYWKEVGSQKYLI